MSMANTGALILAPSIVCVLRRLARQRRAKIVFDGDAHDCTMKGKRVVSHRDIPLATAWQ